MTSRAIAFLIIGAAAVAPAARAQATSANYVYVWATAADTIPPPATAGDRTRKRPVVLLTIDVRPRSRTEGKVVNAMLVDTAGRGAHHTEHALATDGLLFANDFGAGRTHRLDLREHGVPKLLGSFTTAGPMAYPHSFAHLPNGNVLATFQRQSGAGGTPPGALVEVTRSGTLVRWSGAAAPGIDSTTMLPYSLELIPRLDRVVTTSTSMTDDVGVHVQVWRLSTLELLHTLEVPRAPGEPASHGHAAPVATGANTAQPDAHHLYPGEPRLLADGKSVMLGTFTCGLYLLTGIDGPRPNMKFLRAFPGQDCAVPLRIGRFWVQTVPAERAIVTLDVGEPTRPREVSRLVFSDGITPHWLAASHRGDRIVMTSGSMGDPTVHFVRFDPANGKLTREPGHPSVDVSRVNVTGLGTVRIVPHGSVFGQAPR